MTNLKGEPEVYVGSLNPVKIEGTRRAYSRFYGGAKVIGYRVEGLPSQPVGLEETIRLAMRRAEQAPRSDNADAVGVESGLFEVSGEWLVVTAACVLRGASASCGLSPAFQVPGWLAEMSIREGELDVAVERLTGVHDVGSSKGLINIMSGGLVERVDLVEWAVIMALSSLEGTSRLGQVTPGTPRP